MRRAGPATSGPVQPHPESVADSRSIQAAGIEGAEIGLGRKGVGMWAVHDYVTWGDCVFDDALLEPYTCICSSASGNTWLGSVVSVTRQGEEEQAFVLEVVEIPLLKERLGSGAPRAPSSSLFHTWQASQGQISTAWLQTWVVSVPHLALVPVRLAGKHAGAHIRTRARGAGSGAGEDAGAGARLGGDIEALRFYAASLSRIVPSSLDGRPFNRLRQQAVDATAMVALKAIQRCGGAHKHFFADEWWRPPVVTPVASQAVVSLGDDQLVRGHDERVRGEDEASASGASDAQADMAADCRWAVSAGTLALEEAGEGLEKPQEGIRRRLLHLLFLRPVTQAAATPDDVSPTGQVPLSLPSTGATAATAWGGATAAGGAGVRVEHRAISNAQVFTQLATDYAAYMTEDLALSRLLMAYQHARSDRPAPGGRAGRHIIDVGANRCELSVVLAKALGWGVVVTALEPLRRLASVCERVLWRVAEREGWTETMLAQSGGSWPENRGVWGEEHASGRPAGRDPLVSGGNTVSPRDSSTTDQADHSQGLAPSSEVRDARGDLVVRLQVVPRAGSNVTGERRELHHRSAGLGCSVSRGQCDGARETVVTVTVDDVARQLGLLGDEGGGELVLVKVDVEGWEMAVLQGMQHALAARRVMLVVVETGSTWEDGRSAVPGATLWHLVQEMARVRYACFYMGARCLHPLSPPLWHEVYDYRKQHRNVVCAVDEPWLPRLVARYALGPVCADLTSE